MAATRNTVQRALVLDAVRSLKNHPTSAEVYEAVRREYPNISRATVYRNLGLLASRGELLHIPVSGGADHYDFRTDEHSHAVCSSCGRVFDVEMQPVDLASKVSDSYGFHIESCELVFRGLCPDCASE